MASRPVELDGPCPTRRDDGVGVRLVIGAAALVFSLLYLASDVIELLQGGFSTAQLALTYAGEAAVPLLVLGLYAVQRPWIGRVGLAGAVAYAYAFVFFTATVVVALVNRTSDWTALERQLGAWITVHGVLMVLAGVLFGVGVTQLQPHLSHARRPTGWPVGGGQQRGAGRHPNQCLVAEPHRGSVHGAAQRRTRRRASHLAR